jgi:hypothetical protein
MDKKHTTESDQAPEGCFICDVARPFLRDLWSNATRTHFRNSRVEFWKGVRSLVDDRIEHLSRHEQKGQRVTVE